ncbi:MAG TPA: Nramp family divalent metal transporter [Rubrobacteraceae bacterium]
MATSPEVGSAVEEIPSRNLPPVTNQDLPEALPLRKVLGPGLVANGTGLSPGELIIWPYITSQVGLVFLWAVVIGVLTKFFLNMEIERYTLATGETAITDFSRFWKPWGIVFCLCVIISNAWPGVATSGATVLTFALGFGKSMMIAMVSLVALAAALTISPVVYRTLEKIEFFKVGAVIVCLNRAFAHYYAIPSDGGFGSSIVYRRMHYPSGGGPHLLFVSSSYLTPAVSRRKGTAALTVLLGATRFPPNKRRETARTLAHERLL